MLCCLSAIPNYAEVRAIPVMQRTETERVKLVGTHVEERCAAMRCVSVDGHA